MKIFNGGNTPTFKISDNENVYFVLTLEEKQKIDQALDIIKNLSSESLANLTNLQRYDTFISNQTTLNTSILNRLILLESKGNSSESSPSLNGEFSGNKLITLFTSSDNKVIMSLATFNGNKLNL